MVPRVVLAADKFKGSLSAAEVAAALEAGIRRAKPGTDVEIVPIADGGDGTVAAALASGFSAVPVHLSGPTGERVMSAYARRGNVAVVELALAIPEHYHLRNGRFRHLARRALAGLLPAEILESEGPNGALDPDRAEMRRAVLDRAIDETSRLQEHPLLARFVDFPEIRRALNSAPSGRGGALKTDGALQTLLLSKFAAWATRRNEPAEGSGG